MVGEGRGEKEGGGRSSSASSPLSSPPPLSHFLSLRFSLLIDVAND